MHTFECFDPKGIFDRIKSWGKTYLLLYIISDYNQRAIEQRLYLFLGTDIPEMHPGFLMFFNVKGFMYESRRRAGCSDKQRKSGLAV